jgi:hypothetical protein
MRCGYCDSNDVNSDGECRECSYVNETAALKARIAELERQLKLEREITELFFVPDEEVLGIDFDELDIVVGEEAGPPTALETAIEQTEALLVSLRALHGRG